MHSKWKVWDYYKSRKKGILSDTPSIVAFKTFDPLIFKLIKDHFDYSRFSEKKLHVVLGKEVTMQWLDDNFRTMDLFGNQESFLVHFAEEMNKDVKEALLKSDDFLLDGRYLILNYSKSDTFLKKLQKSENSEVVDIQAPMFWENDKLLDFISNETQIYLDYESKQYLLEQTEANVSSYFSICSQLKLNYPTETNLSIDEVKEYISRNKIDNFEFATLFGGKKIRQFYDKLIHLEVDSNELRSIFFFIQSHMLKVYDPSYLEAKKTLTKYDKQILSQSRLWKAEELSRVISYFSKLELSAKRKDHFLLDEVRRDFLRTLNF